MQNQIKILNRLDQVEAYANLLMKEASMLRAELSGVVSDNSPQKGKGLCPEQIAKVLGKREKNRIK